MIQHTTSILATESEFFIIHSCMNSIGPTFEKITSSSVPDLLDNMILKKEGFMYML